MTRPRIGLTTYGPEGEQLPAVSLPIAYVHAVAAAGGTPLLLAPSEAPIPELLATLDALLLTGGGDLDPAVHSGGSHPSVYGVERTRDDFELALVRAALDHSSLPVLGICRGMQVMNVALGGDLELHIPDARGERVAHRLPPREPTRHAVRVDADGPLAAIYGVETFPVCSWHHQALRALGGGLVPCAHAEDGVIEAVSLPGPRFALGVQWHPEMQVADDPLQRRLFEALVAAARER